MRKRKWNLLLWVGVFTLDARSHLVWIRPECKNRAFSFSRRGHRFSVWKCPRKANIWFSEYTGSSCEHISDPVVKVTGWKNETHPLNSASFDSDWCWLKVHTIHTSVRFTSVRCGFVFLDFNFSGGGFPCGMGIGNWNSSVVASAEKTQNGCLCSKWNYVFSSFNLFQFVLFQLMCCLLVLFLLLFFRIITKMGRACFRQM